MASALDTALAAIQRHYAASLDTQPPLTRDHVRAIRDEMREWLRAQPPRDESAAREVLPPGFDSWKCGGAL